MSRPLDRAQQERFIEARRQVQRLDDVEVERRLEEAFSRAHWDRLAPDLGVDDGGRAPQPDRRPLEARALHETERDRLLSGLRAEGWFRTPPFLDVERVGAMRRAVEALASAGWPPVFAYVYDAFWEILRAPSLRALIGAALGPAYRQSPRVWAHHVPAEKGAAGWPPHVDGGAGTHTRDRITVWIPLSEATLENGAIYLVPRSVLPQTAPDDFASDIGSIDAASWRTMLQGCRALPASPGMVLGWDFQVVHWSSLAGEPEAPRVSLAVECLGEGVAPAPSELPMIDPAEIPSFDERLRAVARGLLSYDRFEPAMIRFGGLARRILDRLDLGA